MRMEHREESLEKQERTSITRPSKSRRRRNKRRYQLRAYMQRGAVVLAAVLCLVLGAKGVLSLTSRASAHKKNDVRPVPISRLTGTA